MSMYSFQCPTLKICFPFAFRWFIWELVLGRKTEGLGEYNRERKKAKVEVEVGYRIGFQS